MEKLTGVEQEDGSVTLFIDGNEVGAVWIKDVRRTSTKLYVDLVGAGRNAIGSNGLYEQLCSIGSSCAYVDQRGAA